MPEQAQLFEESCEEDLAGIESELHVLSPGRPRTGGGRKPLPAHLPRIEHRHEPDSCLCPQCGHRQVLIGEDISEQLDVEPARFFVHQHIRPQYACRHCETVSAAPVAPGLVEGG